MMKEGRKEERWFESNEWIIQLILHNIYILNIKEEVKEEEKTRQSYLLGSQIMLAVVPLKQSLFSFDLIWFDLIWFDLTWLDLLVFL